MTMISTSQISRIYAAARDLGMSTKGEGDDLHALVYAVTGKDSIRQLTAAEAREVIRELDKRSVPADTHRRRPAPNPSVYPPGQMTPSQINKCWRLIYSVCASDPSDVPPADRLAGAAERFIGQRPNMMAKNPFRFFTQEQGSKLIESLKRLEYSAEVKKLKRDRKG